MSLWAREGRRIRVLGEELEDKFVKGRWARKAPRAESQRGWGRVLKVPREVSVFFRVRLAPEAKEETNAAGRAVWRVLHRAAGVPARSEDAGWEWEGDADQLLKEGWASGQARV